MHMIIANPSIDAAVDNATVLFHNTNDTQLPWYMGQWTTPVTAVLEAYVLVSFLVFLVLGMMWVRGRGCCHIFHYRGRRRGARYQQQLRIRVRYEQHTNNTTQEDLDEEINGHENNRTSARDPGSPGTEHDIQRLERALRVTGMA